jgi:NSS family neurotransmitter:Na+ symporter
MGTIGLFVGFAFFALMSIAALTSSISMLEAPVSYAVERFDLGRVKATWLIGTIIALVSFTIVLNFNALFGLVIALTTKFGQPILGLMCCLFVGWIWYRNSLLNEIQQGCPEVATSLFWKIWPWYIKFICPIAIGLVFVSSLLG